MIALLCFVMAALAAPYKSKSRLGLSHFDVNRQG
jgi:hypothetical protein